MNTDFLIQLQWYIVLTNQTWTPFHQRPKDSTPGKNGFTVKAIHTHIAVGSESLHSWFASWSKSYYWQPIISRICKIDWQATKINDLDLVFRGRLKMIGKGFYRKWVKSSFEQFISITMQTRVGSTNGWIISQNAEILKLYFSTIFGICDVIKWLRLRGCALSLVLQCVYTVNSR